MIHFAKGRLTLINKHKTNNEIHFTNNRPEI